MKKTGIILIIVAITFFVIAIVISTINKQPVVNNTPNIIKNENAQIYKEHTKGQLTCKMISVSYTGTIGMAEIKVTNNSPQSQPGSLKKIKFITPTETYEEFIYIDEIPSSSSITTKFQFTKKEITNATDYEIKEATAEEIKNFEIEKE